MRLSYLLLISLTFASFPAHAWPGKDKKQSRPAPAPAIPKVGQKFVWEQMKTAGAWAPRTKEQCGKLEIDERYFGPGRNQGQMGWCFAYSLSDLLTHCRASVDATAGREVSDEAILNYYRVSAFDIALGYAAPKWKKGGDRDLDRFLTVLDGGGFPGDAMERLEQRGGTCREWQMTSDPESFYALVKWLGRTKPTEYGTWAAQQKDPDPFGNGTKDLLKKVLQLGKDYEAGKVGYLESDQEYFSRLSFLSDSLKNRGLLDVLKSTTAETYLEELDSRLCTDRQPLPVSCSSSYAYFPKDYINYLNDGKAGKSNIQAQGHSLLPRIDEVLSERKQPVGFAAESHFLKAQDGIDTGYEGGHAMLLIGRDWFEDAHGKGECRYKVRNSWKGYWVKGKEGQDGDSISYCDFYKSPFVKNCDPKTGYFWISEDTLRKNIQFINFLGQ